MLNRLSRRTRIALRYTAITVAAGVVVFFGDGQGPHGRPACPATNPLAAHACAGGR